MKLYVSNEYRVPTLTQAKMSSPPAPRIHNVTGRHHDDIFMRPSDKAEVFQAASANPQFYHHTS